jgi:hypothetical protein
MNLHRSSSHSRRFVPTVCRIAGASIFSAASLLAQAGIDQYSFSGADGDVYGVYSTSDGCITGFVSIDAAAQGAHSLNSQSATSFAFAGIYGFNACNKVFFYGYGSTSTLSFSASGNGSQAPSSITAAGHIPVNYLIYDSNNKYIVTVTDSLAFQTSLNKVGTEYQTVQTTQQTYGTNAVIVRTHIDAGASPASASLAVSTQNLGALTVPSPFGYVFSSRVHQVTIQH